MTNFRFLLNLQLFCAHQEIESSEFRIFKGLFEDLKNQFSQKKFFGKSEKVTKKHQKQTLTPKQKFRGPKPGGALGFENKAMGPKCP